MLFSSLNFVVLLASVFIIFYCVKDSYRWVVLLGGSLVFYGALEAPYLLVALALVTAISYFCAVGIKRSPSEGRKRLLFALGTLATILVLVCLRYLPFLTANLNLALGSTGIGLTVPTVEPMLAIGVSFYVFQAISYLYDVYLEIQEPETHFGYFALYIAFFPKLLQGPIERAGDLLPQLHRQYEFSYEATRAGLFLFTIGLFKKVVIADRLALLVDPIYSDVHSYTGLPLIIATYAYAFQIYFDFSGYTDMALGAAALFGIQLTNNFNAPYLATSVPDFWRRWHITFSRWILDYVFKPLQLSWRNARVWGTALALLVTFLVSGIWHGASWHFVMWGVLHGVYMVGSVLTAPYQKRLQRALRLEKTPLLKVWQVVMTFNLVCLAWVFFRAEGIADAVYVVTHLFSGVGEQLRLATAQSSPVQSLLQLAGTALPSGDAALKAIAMAAIVFVEIAQMWQQPGIFGSRFFKQPAWQRWAVYIALLVGISRMGVSQTVPFVYFQF